MERPYSSSGMVKGNSGSNSFHFEEDRSSRTSWLAKQHYTCRFCNRQFRSAQALGGHMNVHRRDRAARLRFLPSSVSESQNPNHVFASSPSSSSAKFLLHTDRRLPSLSLITSSSPSSASTNEEKKLLISLPRVDPLSPQGKDITNKRRIRSVLGFQGLNVFAQKDEPTVCRKESIVSLDLEIGLLKDQKEDLDLELRLGWY
ncbi:transcriptional regulator SUPERMAN-like [Juglans microcarpa x Juglans regia]|uniref:transcriptional regulator SUPERMAN-like n=1 Tax=Juglans microcarpa x Juglans regia TaxID=2249226 RepID=UPI001B7F202A|nr:transcriptional regulator SUPERMAN-like [Juglans microcarpa x Juglans regia]